MADRPMDRRRFFRQGLRELLRPVSAAVEPVERVARGLGSLEQVMGASAYEPEHRPVTNPGPWLRPPGARPEQEFLSACSRCGECVKACPAQCIQIDPTGINGNGAPFISPEVMPCVLCTDLACMNVCPTKALIPTPLADIDMGTAEWQEMLCFRTRGQECTSCIDHCPVGATAIELHESKIRVNEDGCTGCGVCEHRCPSNPKSIVIRPKSARL